MEKREKSLQKNLKLSLCLALLAGMFVSMLFWVTPCVMAAPDGFETNDSVGLATPITPGYYPALTIDPVGDVDYFNITLVAGDNISVMIFNMVEIFDLYLNDTTGICLDSSTGGSDNIKKVWKFSVTQDGNYTILVKGNETNQGSYVMQVEVPAYDDIYEDNDGFASATELPFPSTTTDLALYDWDYFKMTLSVGQLLNVTLQRDLESGPSYATLAVFNSTYSTINFVTMILSGETYTLLIDETDSGGIFYVGVITTSTWGNYTLILQEIVDDKYEENDVAAAASIVNIDSFDELMSMFQNPILLGDDVDWYGAQINAGECFWAFSNTPLKNATFQMTTSMGVVLKDAMPHPSLLYPFVNYSVTIGGTYKVRVYPTDNPHTVLYALILGRLNVTHPTDISYAPGGTGHSITWRPDDSFFAYYEGFKAPVPEGQFTARIYYNGELTMDVYEWNRTKPVTLGVDGLAEGTHTFRIVVKDWLNCTVEDTVVVTVGVTQTGGGGEKPPDGIPGYPAAFLAGFMLVAIIAIAARKRWISFP